ncbi:hypothetical protein MKX01_004915 [Papaver californicum]|nr:hypothetical protein MKX01_004915 [Papaver californicum]
MGSISTDSLYAVVTGANKGIGLEIVRQLAIKGRGLDAFSLLVQSGLENVVFHQPDVRNKSSVDSLAVFVQSQFARLDILLMRKDLRALNIDPVSWLSGKATDMVQGVIQQPYEKAMECLDTNYYVCKKVSRSSFASSKARIPNEHILSELRDIYNLTEEKVDKIVEKFLHDLKQGMLEEMGWSLMLPSYSISKVALNAYTRVLAKRYPNMLINCVHPGYVNTDINWHTGTMTVEDGAKGPVMLALLSNGEFSGCYFDQTDKSEF